MALEGAPSDERRLYFPANGKEPALAQPVQVTFDRVDSILTPRICILPAAAYEADGKAPEPSAQASGSAQHQMQLSMGQVVHTLKLPSCLYILAIILGSSSADEKKHLLVQATSTSQFERTCLGGAEELDSHGAKAQHACESGWPWSRFRTEHVMVIEAENEHPGQRTIKVDLASTHTQRDKVQSMVAGTGSTLELWETKGTPRVYLIVHNDLVVAILAVEHLLRSHKVRHAQHSYPAHYLAPPTLRTMHAAAGCPTTTTTTTTTSAVHHSQQKEQQWSNSSPEAACKAPGYAVVATVTGAGSPPDIIWRPSTPDQAANRTQQTGQKQMSLFDTLKPLRSSSTHDSTPHVADADAAASCVAQDQVVSPGPSRFTTTPLVTPVALCRVPYTTHSAPLPMYPSTCGTHQGVHDPFRASVNGTSPYSEPPPRWCEATGNEDVQPGSMHSSTPLDTVVGAGAANSMAEGCAGAQKSATAARRARMAAAAAMVRPSRRRRGSRMARMQAQPAQVLSAPAHCAQPAMLPVGAHACQQQQPVGGQSGCVSGSNVLHASAALHAALTHHAVATGPPSLGKRKVAECSSPRGATCTLGRPCHIPRDRPPSDGLLSTVDVCMSDSCQIDLDPTAAAANRPEALQEHANCTHDGCAVGACIAEAEQHSYEAVNGNSCKATAVFETANDSSTQTHQQGLRSDAEPAVENRSKRGGREKPRAVLGVRMLWVARSYRGKGLAEHLLDVARQDVCMTLGGAATRQEVAWASWLVDALGFASQYCAGPEHVLLFNELHCGSKKD